MNTAATTSHGQFSGAGPTLEMVTIARARLLLLAGAVALACMNRLLHTDATVVGDVILLALGVLFGIAVIVGRPTTWQKLAGGTKFVLLCGDAALATGVIYLTGSAASPFLPLYLPVVMLSSILAGRGVGLTITAFITVGYSLTAYGAGAGWLPLPHTSMRLDSPSSALVLQIIGVASAMVLVAVGVTYLMGRLNASAAIAEQSKRDLTTLGHHQTELVNSMSDGIIVTDASGQITSINNAAVVLLGGTEGSFLNERLASVLRPFAQRGAQLGSNDWPSELSIPCGSDVPLHVVLTRSELTDFEGMLSGHVVTLRNVTELHSAQELLAVHERMAHLLASQGADEVSAFPRLTEFVGESGIIKKVFQLIQRVAPTDTTVMVNGESGTGKELVAKALHLGSLRASGPFVPVNCGAIPESLIESELFGHKKGSFTGADSDTTGLFRQAEGGTIFLDEIGELPLPMQVKLLRTIQERTVRPVGGSKDIPVDVRIVAATNRNLRKEIEKGAFREDLYYRLNVISISLPPLRDRREDLPLLITSILSRMVHGENLPAVSPAAMALLNSYSYPGNVRELENILERAFVLGGQVILPEHLPEHLQKFGVHSGENRRETSIVEREDLSLPVNLDEVLAQVERKYLEVALLQARGAKKRAAELLGINFRSFRYRLQKFDMQGHEEPEAEARE